MTSRNAARIPTQAILWATFRSIEAVAGKKEIDLLHS